jgi:predicted DCC family thiol-disulfide oxidoreductase YuxK
VVIYDGRCGFCSQSMKRWQSRISSHDIIFLHSGSEAACDLTERRSPGSVRLLEADGAALAGIEAVYRLAELGGVRAGGWALRLHRKVVPFAMIGNGIYGMVAAHRGLISRVFGFSPDIEGHA